MVSMQYLCSGAARLGLQLNSHQLEQFQTYYRELIDWNSRINLTAITEPKEVQLKHFLDYKIPTFLDIPDLGSAFVETDEPTSGYGNKSLGEPPIISPPPAIRNAILAATGVAINELPIRPQTLFNHLSKAGYYEK